VFLKVEPYKDRAIFKKLEDSIKKPAASAKSNTGLSVLISFLSTVLLRRTKNSTNADGTPIGNTKLLSFIATPPDGEMFPVSLPKRSVDWHVLDMNKWEQNVYDFLFLVAKRIASQSRELVSQSAGPATTRTEAAARLLAIRHHLLRACNHPFLLRAERVFRTASDSTSLTNSKPLSQSKENLFSSQERLQR